MRRCTRHLSPQPAPDSSAEINHHLALPPPGGGGDDPMALQRSEQGSNRLEEAGNKQARNAAGSPHSSSPSGTELLGVDLAWRTILGSVVEVEGIGEVSIARLIQEVWNRGGGDMVSAHSLWPSVMIALSAPQNPPSPGVQGSTPSHQASVGLQDLYNLTLRPWEPAIFSGLLAAFAAAGTNKSSCACSYIEAGAGEGYPTLGIDVVRVAAKDKEPERQLVALTTATSSSQHRPSDAACLAGNQPDAATVLSGTTGSAAEAVHLLTLDEGSPRSPVTGQPCPRSVGFSGSSPQDSLRLTPYESAPSTFAPATTDAFFASTPTTTEVAQKAYAAGTDARSPLQLNLPLASCNTLPPMCMFFSPSFRDLQHGKVDVWKGNLEIKGIGGGMFSVLIVGEETTGYLWQAHTWQSTVTYPPFPTSVEGYTATMMPVSHIVREGFTPVAMGMVLCNDSNISQYVAMVQGLHAEGVAFLLPTALNLPVVVLPAKFNSADPLQRLGIAFMSKPGCPLPSRPPTNPLVNVSSVSAAKRGADNASSRRGPQKKKKGGPRRVSRQLRR